MDGGTQYQLCNLIQRNNVVKAVKKKVAECEELFTLIVEARVISAGFGMQDIDDGISYLPTYLGE